MSDCVLEEKEFTKMDNKILEQLIKTPLSGQEFRIILLILRKTWGWHKEEDYIALSQIQKELNICKTRASQIINRLQLMKIVTVTENINGLTKRYCFNKQFEEWIPLRKSVTVTEKRNQPLRKSVTTKESLTKENIYIADTTKKTTASYTAEQNSQRFEEIWEKYPNADGRKEALRHFKATVKTDMDWDEINKALENYLDCKKVKDGYIKNGSTWFNNWRDWIKLKEPKEEFNEWG